MPFPPPILMVINPHCKGARASAGGELGANITMGETFSPTTLFIICGTHYVHVLMEWKNQFGGGSYDHLAD